MRILVLAVVILCASVVLAKDRQWKSAKVTNITYNVGVLPPTGAILFGVRIVGTFYWIQTDDATYVIGPALGKGQSLHVTLYGKTKIAMDGRDAHIMDDRGKDRKLPIAQKVAESSTESLSK